METIRRFRLDFVFSGLLALGASGPGMQKALTWVSGKHSKPVVFPEDSSYCPIAKQQRPERRVSRKPVTSSTKVVQL